LAWLRHAKAGAHAQCSEAASLITAEPSYLLSIIGVISAEHPSGPTTDAEISRVAAVVEGLDPGSAFPVFVCSGLPAVWSSRQLCAATGAGVRQSLQGCKKTIG